MKRLPIMVVGGRYKLLKSRNGFSPGEMLECIGADVKKNYGEFGLPADVPAVGKLKAAIWYFDWEDVRYEKVPTPAGCDGT